MSRVLDFSQFGVIGNGKRRLDIFLNGVGPNGRVATPLCP